MPQPLTFKLGLSVKKHYKFVLAIASTIIITFMVTSYFATRNTRAAYVNLTLNMETFNELYRIKSWDSLELLLTKGCTKEALEYVRMEQSLGLLSLEYNLKHGAKLDNALAAENHSILNRANTITSKGKYDIPTCD